MKSVLAPGLSDMKKAPVHTRKHHRRVILNGIAKFPVFAIEWQLRGPPHAHAQLYSVRQADTRGHGEGYGCRAASSPSSTLTPSTLPRPSLTKSSTGVHQPAFLAPSKPCVHAASSSPNAAESVQEGADAGRAAATAMIALGSNGVATVAAAHRASPMAAAASDLSALHLGSRVCCVQCDWLSPSP